LESRQTDEVMQDIRRANPLQHQPHRRQRSLAFEHLAQVPAKGLSFLLITPPGGWIDLAQGVRKALQSLQDQRVVGHADVFRGRDNRHDSRVHRPAVDDGRGVCQRAADDRRAIVGAAKGFDLV